MPLPPATYYGKFLPGPGFIPEAGMMVTAFVDDKACGQGKTQFVGGMVVYSVNVFADGPGAATGCGTAGRQVTFQVGSIEMITTAAWDVSRVWELALVPKTGKSLFLPIILNTQ